MLLCVTKDAATSSCVDSGFEAHTTTSAPPALSVDTRFAVSVVTCKHAESRMPLSGFSFANRFLINRSTGISRSAHSIRFFPSPARAIFLMSRFIFKFIIKNRVDFRGFLQLLISIFFSDKSFLASRCPLFTSFIFAVNKNCHQRTQPSSSDDAA